MQSQRKFKRPKKLTMNAEEFARPFAQNVGSYAKAVLMSDNYEFASREHSKKSDVHKDEKREAIRTANFYANVSGILRKTQIKMGVQPTPKRTAGDVGGPIEQKNITD